jgi:hypothetical protein
MKISMRIGRALVARLDDARSSIVFSAEALGARRSEQAGGYPAEALHDKHLEAALGWLERAQDATPDDGFARAYSLTWNPYFRAAGWQPSYPETTGYIIPTLYTAAHFLKRPALAQRATRAAHWEIAVQLRNGAVQGGVIGQPQSPAVFNTGQVIFGWLAALEETGDEAFADAVRRAGEFLVGVEVDGQWRKGNSQYARADATAYNARTAWALAEAGLVLREPSFTDCAARVLASVAAAQTDNGWFRNCCLNDPEHPLLHTIAYTVRGLLEGGRILEDAQLMARASRAAEVLASHVRADGWMAGRFDSGWRAAVSWSCLTGEAQCANNWLRLHQITGNPAWLEPVAPVIGYLKRRQNRLSKNDGVRGGIPGSAPIDAEYGRHEVLNWATKYFADALMRDSGALDHITVAHLA